MSGGSYNYIYSKLLDECSGCMCDGEMNSLINDLAKVLHDLEWWQSSDMSEDEYRATLSEFKDKWLKGEQEKQRKEQVDELKQHIYELSVALDTYSAGKDYVALRRTHYNNIEWLQEHGLTNEYYNILFSHIKAEKKNRRKNEQSEV